MLNRRKFLTTTGAVGAAGALATPDFFIRSAQAAGAIRVGVLFSLTGGLSIIEKSLADATMMAISEINAGGGVKGMKIEAILEDGASDPKTYNEKASKLVIQDRVPTVFGSYTSASRKAVLPVFEKRNNLYFYPTYYEGFECSKNVVYTGAVPNQQLSNFIPWIIKTLGKKKFFIVGSNYIYPREMAKVSKILIEKSGGEWIADEYLELGDSEWGSMVNKIKSSGCDVVLSNVVGDSVVAFYREFKNQGLTHDKLPICATVTSEIEIAAMGAGICGRKLHLLPLLPGHRHRYQQGVRRALPEVCEGSQGGHASRAGVFLFPGVHLEAGRGEGERSNADSHSRCGERPRVQRAKRARQNRARKPAHLADAAHRTVAGGRSGQNHRSIQSPDQATTLRGVRRNRR